MTGKNPQEIRSVPESKRVLLADSSATFAHMLEQMIQTRLPYVEVLHAGRPERVDSLLESESFDVVFLDTSIFPENGFQFIKPLKRRLPRGQLVVLTTHDSAEHRATALDQGADCFISKNHATGKHLVDFVQAALL